LKDSMSIILIEALEKLGEDESFNDIFEMFVN